MLDVYEIFFRSMTGQEVTAEEKEKVRAHSIRYELVRFLYMEKMKHEGKELKDFHFTPGEKWMDIPIYDIVSELVKFNTAIRDGKVKRMNFGDERLKKSGPPETGMKKVDLNEL